MKFNSLITALAITAFAFTGCDNNTETTTTGDNSSAPATQTVDPSVVDNPMTAAEGASPSNEKLPEISFPSETHDFGKIKQGEVMKHKFKFKNTGNADLIITSASGSCGCTVPDWPKNPIPPGGEANIDVEYNSAGKTGMQRVNVTLIANTIPNTKVLTITGEVEAPN
ncbi:MAG: DUF1573 domain-containing protein [Bacteroidia bacterium]